MTQGKLHRVIPMPDKDGYCDIWVLRFKSEFIPETTFQLYSSFHNKANIPMTIGQCFERLDILCAMIWNEFHQDAPELSIIRQLLSTIFTMIESERHKLHLSDGENKKIQSNTFQHFLQLLEEHYTASVGVDFYAAKLFMSARNLNNVCHNILQQSVSEIIETRKLIEAKNLLITSDMPVSEIGYALGFKEKTYFTHAFKKKAGMTPSEFREEMSKLIS